MGKSGILKILIIVFGALDAIALIGVIVMLILSSKGVETVTLQPDFIETELNVSSQYTFTVKTDEDDASAKKTELVCSDPSISFTMSEDGKAVLYTSVTEGTFSVYAMYKDVKSNDLTFTVVDMVAREQAEAEAAAAAQAEAEAAAAEAEAAAAEAEVATMYVRMKGDDVNVRAENNTNCSVLGKAKKGEVFEKLDTVDDWTHIMYNGQEGYIKTEYLEDISEEEAMNPTTTATEEKKEETTNTETAQQNDDAAKKAAEAAQQQAALLAQQQAAAAAGTTLECADGAHAFTAAQYNFLKGFWQREGQTSPDDWKVYAHKHTAAECITICQVEGGIY